MWREFLLLHKKVKTAFTICLTVKHFTGSPSIERGLQQAPSPGTTFRISVSSCPSCEQCLWTSELYLHLFHAFINKVCTKVTASSFYTISDYQRFHTSAAVGETWNISTSVHGYLKTHLFLQKSSFFVSIFCNDYHYLSSNSRPKLDQLFEFYF